MSFNRPDSCTLAVSTTTSVGRIRPDCWPMAAVNRSMVAEIPHTIGNGSTAPLPSSRRRTIVDLAVACALVVPMPRWASSNTR